MITIMPLVLCELLKAFCFITNDAPELYSLATYTFSAFGEARTSEGSAALDNYGVSQHIELSFGVRALHADLFARHALDSVIK